MKLQLEKQLNYLNKLFNQLKMDKHTQKITLFNLNKIIKHYLMKLEH